MYFINLLEKEIGKKAILNMLPMQKGDVYKTWACVAKLDEEIGYKPRTSLNEGVKEFVSWYKFYYGK